MSPNRTSVWKLMTIRFSRELPLFNFERLFFFLRLNRTFVWHVMTIWISRELSLFNFESLNIVCAWIGLPCDKLWPFEFLESFRCSILSASICDEPESDIRVKSYDLLNFSRAFVVRVQCWISISRDEFPFFMYVYLIWWASWLFPRTCWCIL